MPKARKIKSAVLNFNAVFLEETDGGYSVMVPALPGCFSQGNAFEEALRNIKEAIGLYLEGTSAEEKLYRPEREFMVSVTP